MSGSKNATLAIMAGAVLAEGVVTLRNVPRIDDVATMLDLLNCLGARARFTGEGTVEIDGSTVHLLEAPYDLVRKMRASFCVMGPLLARFGCSRVPVPGGCDIGARPVNLHIDGLRQLGATIDTEHGIYTARSERLRGASIYLDFQSAGATQHLMTAACLGSGTTLIENCACEPEVVDLARFLNTIGADIEGAGTTTLTVHGVSRLTGGDYTVIPDRMEAGTFAVAAAVTRGDILMRGAVRDHMRPVLTKLAEAGVRVTEQTDGMRVACDTRVRHIDIKTNPHPAFPTDMHQPFAAMLATGDGTSVIAENVYEGRFRYVNELSRMGAQIKVEGRTAVITGVSRLTGAPVSASDLRAGAALVCAALAADGETELQGMDHVERGYADLPGKLRGLGADIELRDVDESGGLRRVLTDTGDRYRPRYCEHPRLRARQGRCAA